MNIVKMRTVALHFLLLFFGLAVSAQPQSNPVPKITWDGLSLMEDGRRVVPVMGEIHYSRVPAEEWGREVHKMKLGGVTMIACYVFWNHIEEKEGVFDWSGQRNLRQFLEICKKEDLPVILRVGPFCHGETRNGGIPDWVFQKGFKTRDLNPGFLRLTTDLYRQIFTQIQGLQWKDGGPVIAAQFDNEYGGYSSYLLTLKKIAKGIGFDLPFYTNTGWPGLKDKMPYGEMIPLFGDYADGFWDRSTKEGVGEYWQAFHFRPGRANAAIGSEQINYSEKRISNQVNKTYPYFTCELGGGMIPSYHRRVYMYPEDAYAMALVKLGSGSNLLGYYMYHGGTNPEGRFSYLNENQKTIATNYNDLPVKTYEYQAPLGEFGQVNPQYYMLRKLHVFMKDYGDLLAPMISVFPEHTLFKQGDDSRLRWSYRHNGNEAFVFVNNYERFGHLSAKRNVTFSVCGIHFPQKSMTIPAGVSVIFPVNITIGDACIRYATAQLFAKQTASNGDTLIYFFQPKDIATEMVINGKLIRHLTPKGENTPIWKKKHTRIYLFTEVQAEHFGLDEQYLKDNSPKVASVLDPDHPDSFTCIPEDVDFKKVKNADGNRKITIGVSEVAEEPADSDFNHAAVYIINLKNIKDIHQGLKTIDIIYRGDVARLYADGQFIDDNFYNGRHFQYGLWRLPKDCRQLELRILPLEKDMPVYFPREADITPGEKLISVKVY
jgi:hypothetical protein